MIEKYYCKDCRLANEIKPLIINPEGVNVAHDLADCALLKKTVILSDMACDEIMPKKKNKK